MADYFDEYKYFDQIAEQVDSIAEFLSDFLAMHNFKRTFSIPFTFVDIGSSDGELTARVAQMFAKQFESVKVHAIEPSSAAYPPLCDRFKKNQFVETSNRSFQDWMETGGSKLEGKVDFILNSHTFYHFGIGEYKRIFDSCNGLLSEAGQHVVIIDSKLSAFSEAKQMLDEAIGSKKPVKTDWQFSVGEDIKHFLVEHKIPFTPALIDRPILIPDYKEAEETFARIAGFVCLYTPEDILAHARPQMKEFMERHKRGSAYSFSRHQDVFILGRY